MALLMLVPMDQPTDASRRDTHGKIARHSDACTFGPNYVPFTILMCESDMRALNSGLPRSQIGQRTRPIYFPSAVPPPSSPTRLVRPTCRVQHHSCTRPPSMPRAFFCQQVRTIVDRRWETDLECVCASEWTRECGMGRRARLYGRIMLLIAACVWLASVL